MPAGKQGAKEITVTLGGVNIESFLLDGLDAENLSEMVETTPLGAQWKTQAPAGLQGAADIALGGLFDTTAVSGSHALLSSLDSDPTSSGASLVIAFGDSKTYTVTVFTQRYKVRGEVGQLTKFESTLATTGAGTWA